VWPLLPADEPARSWVGVAVARALAVWCQATSRPALGWAIEPGPTLADGPLAPFLPAAGFVRSGPGFRLASAAPSQSTEEDDA
jgi:hypothetical protein